jgi:hypothetical protein
MAGQDNVFCGVSNQWGGLRSDTVVLVGTNGIAPAISVNLTNITKGTNETATFSIVATGEDTLSYRWLINSVTAWSTSNSLVFTGTTLAMSNRSVQCVVTSQWGSATSALARLYITNAIVTTPIAPARNLRTMFMQ